MKSFFWSFGTSWRWVDSYGGGLMSTRLDRRDKPHHKSILRSSPFIVTSTTRLSIDTRGGTGAVDSVAGQMADFSGSTSPEGFLGVAIWQRATGMWALSKRRTEPNQDADEVITFSPEELAPLVGLEVTVDVVDTFGTYWGWITVRSFTLEGTCGGQQAPISSITASAGEECHFNKREGLQSFFGSIGIPWYWSTRFGGGFINAEVKRRDWEHSKSILRSVPFEVTPTTHFSLLTRGGKGAQASIDGTAVDVSGKTAHDGFLGVAVRLVLTDHWVVSKRRHSSSQEDDEEITFEKADLQELVGQVVTIDVVDTFHGWWGWLSIRELRLHGPCQTTQTNAPLDNGRNRVALKTTTGSPPETTAEEALAKKAIDGPCVPKKSKAKPSLYCFSVMNRQEVQLIQEQFKRRASIFACNEYNVISNIPMSIGKDECGDEVYTWHNDVKAVPLGNLKNGQATSSFLNTETFILAWDTLLAGGKVPDHDFIVKVDPDCVFFPERLRQHLDQFTGQTVLVKNCGLYGVKLFGALEAFSEPAIDVYRQHRDQCKEMNWRGWGEDLYMENCLTQHGVKSVEDFKEVGDGRCKAAPCSDSSVAAYHPYKDSKAYWACWEESPK
jgi:hypothetical protein